MKNDIETLLNSSTTWLLKDTLDEVVIHIHRIYSTDPNLITGEILGLLAKRLLDSEIEVGGPYLSKDDLYTNMLILRLFRAMNIPLHNLENYMKNKLYIPQNKYEKTALQLPIKKSINKTDPSVKKSNPVIIDFKKSISDLPTDIYKSAVIFLNKITEIDKNQEITLISNYLIRSFIKQPSKKNIDLSYKFGEANLYAWIAYTIYDDFVDDEGLPELLPLANIFHRRSFIIYLRHYQSKKPLIVSHYDSVDTSNLWELQKCRAKVKGGKIFLRNIPDYKNGTFLAKRAIGHVLGPKILIENYNLSLHQKKLIFEALDKYLIAKQINDDIEDWKIDLHNGHISYVVAKLLNSSGKRIGEYDIENLIIELQHEFWETVLEECLLFALNELKKAENCLKKSNSFKSKNLFIDNIIQPLEITIQTSMKNHQNDKLFFKSYTI